MKITQIKLSDLHEYENNPRNNDGAVDAVAASIREFGFKVPVIVDCNNVIVAGHTRVKAAKKLGMSAVPCIVADDLTPEQIKAFRLADNKVGEIAFWDFEKLNAELEELSLDFDMTEFGFDLEEDDDIEPIDDEELNGSDIVQHVLALDRQKIILTDEEYEQFKNKIDEFVEDNGVTFGFERWLLND